MIQPVCSACARPLAYTEATCFACAARPEAAELPEHIGPYPVLRAIGAGGMGDVYAGRQHCPARDVAIKVMRDGVFADPELRAQFLREREIAGCFEHPNIIRVYDAGQDEDGQLYYVMELAQRGTLRSFIRDEPLCTRDAVRLMVEVAFAVDYAHRRGVLHRDLKPDNILIGEDRRARVTDFGVARLLVQDVQDADARAAGEGTFVGSYSYMAPEQAGYRCSLQPAAAAGIASDVYSLGAIMYELLHGTAPYFARDRQALLQAFAAGPPATLTGFRSGFDVDVEAVVAKALEHDPARRYQSAAAFAEDLRRTLGGRVPVARPRKVRTRLQSTVAHHAAWCSILVAALSISAGVVMALNDAAYRARLRENADLRGQATRTATAIARIFKHAGEITRQMSRDPKNVEALAHPHDPSALVPDGAWLEHEVRDNDLVNTAFLVNNDGRVTAHYPREAPSYYQLHFAGRSYFRGASLAARQGLGLAVFVSPLFHSRASDALTKLAFSAPVYDDEHEALGIAVTTVTLERLTHEIDDPRLALLAPREVDLDRAPSANVQIVRVELDRHRQLSLDPASAPARQLFVANVAQTDYAVAASVQDPPLSALRSDLLLGVTGLVCLCVLALFLLRRARTERA